jgi:hypothetical protein
MNQEEILRVMLDEKKKQKLKTEVWEEKAGVRSGNIREVLNGNVGQMGLLNVIKLLNVLDLQLVVEDKDAEWGENMERLRMMPKKLFLGERIESRELVRSAGFYPRVDLFDSLESVLKFMPKPLDVYEIRLGRLIRRKFDVIHHPFGTMYSYNEHIAPGSVVNRTTHR